MREDSKVTNLWNGKNTSLKTERETYKKLKNTRHYRVLSTGESQATHKKYFSPTKTTFPNQFDLRVFRKLIISNQRTQFCMYLLAQSQEIVVSARTQWVIVPKSNLQAYMRRAKEATVNCSISRFWRRILVHTRRWHDNLRVPHKSNQLFQVLQLLLLKLRCCRGIRHCVSRAEYPNLRRDFRNGSRNQTWVGEQT